MVGVTSEDAQLQFLNIMRCLPYGNSVFFAAKLIEDPTGLLPPNLALGINKRGIHFFRQQPKGYLYSAGLEDIMQFGSSAQARPSCHSTACLVPSTVVCHRYIESQTLDMSRTARALTGAAL